MKTKATTMRKPSSGHLTNVVRNRVAATAAALAAVITFIPVAVFLSAGRAWADEYEPVGAGGVVRAATDPNPFVIGAYGFIWVALVIYVVGLARGLARANAEIAELRRRVAGGGTH